MWLILFCSWYDYAAWISRRNEKILTNTIAIEIGWFTLNFISKIVSDPQYFY